MPSSVVQREHPGCSVAGGWEQSPREAGSPVGAVSVILAAEGCSWAAGGCYGELDKGAAPDDAELVELVHRLGMRRGKEKIARRCHKVTSDDTEPLGGWDEGEAV